MNRTPPIDVRRILRKEVGFGCPVEGCGSPYLYWHHFDPTWEEKEHHNPDGMIALCAEHHKKADYGAFSKTQLKALKANCKDKNRIISGRFDWMRNDLLAVLGSNFFYEIPILIQYKQSPVIWFNRDDNGYFLLNVRMLSGLREPRLIIEDNYWISEGSPTELESPPSGKSLKIVYDNGDMLRIEFTELKTSESLIKKYPGAIDHLPQIPFPITLIEIDMEVGGTNIKFTPRKSTFLNMSTQDCFSSKCSVGIRIN